MTSGRKSRAGRRVQVPRAPAARRRQASPRVLIGAVVLLVAIGAGVGLAVGLSGGGSSVPATVPSIGTLDNALPFAGEVAKTLKGIPQQGNVLGRPSAPVTVVEYVDLQCPYCREFEANVFPDLVSKYVRTGKVKVVMRVLGFIGSDSLSGRNGALAASLQNHMFDFTQLLYFNQGAENTGWLNDEIQRSAAASIPGLDVNRFLADRSAADISSQAQRFDQLAKTDGVTSTPTVLVGKSDTTAQTVALTSPNDATTLFKAIDQALK